METTLTELERKTRALRLDIIKMIGVGQKGHLGGDFSIVEIVTALYFYKMKHDPKNPQWEDRDRFLLSEGHAALVQYAALAEAGYFSKSGIGKGEVPGCNASGTSGYADNSWHRSQYRIIGTRSVARLRNCCRIEVGWREK